MTPRYFASSAGWIVVPSMVIEASVFVPLFLVKWMRTYFDFSNWAPCFCRHVSAFSSILVSFPMYMIGVMVLLASLKYGIYITAASSVLVHLLVDIAGCVII